MLAHSVEIDQHGSLVRQQNVGCFEIAMRDVLMPQLEQDPDNLALCFFDLGMGNIFFKML